MNVSTAQFVQPGPTERNQPGRNERLASLPGFLDLHPYQDESTLQGMLELLFELQQMLAEIAGLPAVSAQAKAPTRPVGWKPT